jgi:hypothetical protein
MSDVEFAASPGRIPRCCKHRGTGQWYVTLNGREHYLGRHKATAKVLDDPH